MTIKTPSDIKDEELKTELLDLIFVIADSKLAIVEQTSPWLVNSPTVDSRLFTARFVADELNHAWQMSRMIEDFGEKDKVKELQELRLGLHRLEPFNLPLFTWEDAVAFVFVIDSYNVILMNSLMDCEYEPLSKLAKSIVKDDEYHTMFSENEIIRLSRENRNKIQGALNFWLPRLNDVYEHMRKLRLDKLFSLRVNNWLTEESESSLVSKLNEKLVKIGLDSVAVKKYTRN
ncbi:Phenylacetic acid catabolic protein [Sulfolobus acidocaldarius]|uniref:Phenylacetic acid catabolic protein n=4 Tax=Sulfolobus acidocaldarius TaxID=2285 RepID=Q4J805_SULAC|nr:Phenylacetic acid catabolic protein [Sulfolobus acidocaldarius]AAY81076.1 phenylacetic acid catabolic protein [Sulfolobus acidocaldarius DSM 639]AGE71683.1 phenylacetic acid catabolic protein [Sulfolobus acidocaldarius N8]AGE73956.1 phenylacetic acid catabolic protein [Sulfolobus acidocaldarius Ron12/I]ALU30106.1 phenylacetic acid catabolic protein [Sulfolobus acidocaldarius]ALU30799.1 phenylacetic acid catabolic protein [Sulfolobus acidocaldarius]